MSVPKSERKESKFEILEMAKKIRNALCDLALRDFGIKDRKRTSQYDVKAYHMTDEDGKTFVELLEKYGISQVNDKYPAWFIEKLRDRLLNDVFDLVRYIEYSNVYPTSVYECNIRRKYQDEALAILHNLYQWLELAGTVSPLDLNQFDKYFDLIQHEIAAIKSLRKHDNQVLNKLKRKEADGLKAYLTSATSSDDMQLTERQIDRVLDLMTSIEKYI